MMLHELNEQEKAEYQDVASELRCLVCQNQSIADSQAGLADDLKQIIVDQIRDGQNKGEIKQYMVDRYGEFILYQPEMHAGNAVLWAGPVVVLLLAIVLARRVIRHSRLKRAVKTTDSQPGGSETRPAAAGAGANEQGQWAEELYQRECEQSARDV